VIRPRFSTPTSFRRLLYALIAFGVIVIFDVALFGWLIFRSLSQREIEDVLLETRQEAAQIAERIAGRAAEEGADLYTVIAVERETRTYIDDVLEQKGVVSSIRVLDKDGALVYEATGQVKQPVGGGGSPPGLDAAGDLDSEIPKEIPGGGTVRTEETVDTSKYQVEEPIGDFGMLRIGISEEDLQARIGELRHDLIGQASVIGGVTTALLLAALALIWVLLRRSHRLEEQAAEAERMAYIGTLASGLAHEIRNPLNSLNLNMQMLEEELEPAAGGAGRGSGRRLLTITRTEIARLERLVTDFLSYARPRALEVEEVEVEELLEQVRAILEGEARSRGVALEVGDRTGGMTVWVDPGQMRQLLLNLAQNAISAAEGRPDGQVVLAAEPRDLREGLVELIVEDNGAGIPADQVERIFDVFYSTRKGGTGLGLAIVDRIARRHDGSVEVESEAGRGTTFRVVLPRAATAQAPLSSSSSAGEMNSSGSSLPHTSQSASLTTPSFHSKT
jgi:signal transduction histidine kinase